MRRWSGAPATLSPGKEVIHRALDLVFAAVVSIIVLPVLLLRGAIAMAATGRVFDRQVLLGNSASRLSGFVLQVLSRGDGSRYLPTSRGAICRGPARAR